MRGCPAVKGRPVPGRGCRWYDVAGPGEKTGARALVYLRRREGVGTRPFRKFVTNELAPALANTGLLTELRTQIFMPWNEKLWDTPNVAHDNPTDQRFHASLILGFADAAAREAFFDSEDLTKLCVDVAHVHTGHMNTLGCELETQRIGGRPQRSLGRAVDAPEGVPAGN